VLFVLRNPTLHCRNTLQLLPIMRQEPTPRDEELR
jgi:hypothetical protein